MQTIAFKSGSYDPNLNLSIISDMLSDNKYLFFFFLKTKFSQDIRKYKLRPSANDEALSCLFINCIKIYYVHAAHHEASVSPRY